MPIRFHCQCGKSFTLPDNVAGKKARCQQCGKVLTVPMPRGAARPAAAPRAPAQPMPTAPAAGANLPLPKGNLTAETQQCRAAEARARPTQPPVDDVPLGRIIPEHEAAMRAILSVSNSVAFLAAFESEQVARETIGKFSFLRQGPKGPALPPNMTCTLFHKAGGVLVVLGGVISDAEFTEIYNRMEKFGSVDEVKRWQEPDDEDIPVARLVEPSVAARGPAPGKARVETDRGPARLGARKLPIPGSLKAVLLIVTVVTAVIAVDAIILIAQKPAAGEQSEGRTHGLWLIALAIGYMVALVAVQGNVFCIGALIGGAGGSLLLRAPLTLLGAAGDFFPRWVLAVGAVELVLGWAYLMLLLNGKVRERLAGHGPPVIVGIVVGFLFGEVVAPTALPSPAMLLTRGLSTSKAGPQMERWFSSLDKAGGEDREMLARNYLAGMTYAISEYSREQHGALPLSLSALKKSEKFDPCQLDGICGGKVVYVFGAPGGTPYTYAQLNGENKAIMQELVFAYIQRDPPFASGVLVLRPPVSSIDMIQWVPRSALPDNLKKTQEWLDKNLPKEPEAPQLPGLSP